MRKVHVRYGHNLMQELSISFGEVRIVGDEEENSYTMIFFDTLTLRITIFHSFSYHSPQNKMMILSQVY